MQEIENLKGEIKTLEYILADVYFEYKHLKNWLLVKELNKKMGIAKKCR